MTTQKVLPPFLPFPRFLLTDERFYSLSNDAKLCYTLFLDRASVSQKNKWLDGCGRVFFYYSIKELCKICNRSKQTMTNVVNELSTVDLICRKRQGLGKPSIIYVRIPSDVQLLDAKTTKVLATSSQNSRIQADQNLDTNHKNFSNTKFSQNQSINEREKKQLLENLGTTKNIPLEYAKDKSAITDIIQYISEWENFQYGYQDIFLQEIYLSTVQSLIEMATTPTAIYKQEEASGGDVLEKINWHIQKSNSAPFITDMITDFVKEFHRVTSEINIASTTAYLKSCLWSHLKEYHLKTELDISSICI